MQSWLLFSWILLVMMLLEVTTASLGNFKCIWNRTTEYIFYKIKYNKAISLPAISVDQSAYVRSPRMPEEYLSHYLHYFPLQGTVPNKLHYVSSPGHF